MSGNSENNSSDVLARFTTNTDSHSLTVTICYTLLGDPAQKAPSLNLTCKLHLDTGGD